MWENRILRMKASQTQRQQGVGCTHKPIHSSHKHLRAPGLCQALANGSLSGRGKRTDTVSCTSSSGEMTSSL